MTDASATPNPFSGLDLLATAVVALDGRRHLRYANPAAESLLAASFKTLANRHLHDVLGQSALLDVALDNALSNHWNYTGQSLEFTREGQDTLHLDVTITPLDSGKLRVLLELRPVDQILRVAREERILEQQQANRELIRNLAHEIKNPLGGLRGAAQLLERELDRPQLKEYTQVIIQEADRLQDLMNRLLTPHRLLQPVPLNIHEVLERVRSVLRAEFPEGLTVSRDYDTSLPELVGDREKLIQATLNVARNAAQALQGQGTITLRTRVGRQVTIAKKRYRLALMVDIIDDGPGIDEALRERIFYPLVSGRDGGSGLGLTLAQTFVQQHHGVIDCDSRPGRTCFTILLPYNGGGNQESPS